MFEEREQQFGTDGKKAAQLLLHNAGNKQKPRK
jgi:hypothetical protein